MGWMMVEFRAFQLFFGDALLVAITPEPGIFYVGARAAVTGGRAHGLASSLGTGVGALCMSLLGRPGSLARYGECGSLHSAQARRSCLSDLDWLQDIERNRHPRPDRSGGSRCRTAFRQGIIVEALNPKWAGFFFAFTPQFIERPPMSPGSSSSLGTVSVALNAAADVVVTHLAATQHEPAWPSDHLPSPKCDRRLVQLCGRWDLHVELHFLLRGDLLITLGSILSAAACLPTLHRNLSAVCSGKTTASMRTTAFLSRSPRVALV